MACARVTLGAIVADANGGTTALVGASDDATGMAAASSVAACTTPAPSKSSHSVTGPTLHASLERNDGGGGTPGAHATNPTQATSAHLSIF